MASRSTASRTEPTGDDSPRLSDAPARLQCVIDLSLDFYWEQDSDNRCTLLLHRQGPRSGGNDIDPIGKRPWEHGSDSPLDPGFERHRATLAAREAFDDYLVCRTDANSGVRYLSVSGRPVFDAAGIFRGYRGIARDVTTKVRAEQLLRLERAITAILAETDDTTEALQACLRLICETEQWEAGNYWSLDEAENVMRWNVGWCVGRKAVEEFTRESEAVVFKPSEGLVGKAWKTQETLWVRELEQDCRIMRKDMAERTGWHAALLVPVRSRHRTIGVLNFNAPEIPEPDLRLINILDVLSIQIGNFYERAVTIEKLRESEELYASTVEMAAIGISHIGRDGRFLHANKLLCDMLGYSKEELLGLTIKDISHPEDASVTDRERIRLHEGEISHVKVEKRYLRKDGSPVWVRITAAHKRGPDGKPLYDISIIEDISERKEAEERVQYLAAHDEMTGLPNRATFSQLLNHSIERSHRHGRSFSVLFIDLDRFKIVNDSLGHQAGDILLKEMSTRLRDSVRGADVVARLGGDEFVVLLDDTEDPRQAASLVSRKILSAVLKPVEILGQECRVTASIGIAVFPDDGEEVATIMRKADSAMYLAKEEGKNNYQFYQQDINPMSVERLTLETHLRRALEQDEFTVQYQAKVDTKTGEIKGAEALLRWWNHELGTISPAQFIPVAEDTGLIVPIGKWVLRKACEQNIAWQRQGLPLLVMAVNLSPRQFKDANLLSDLSDVLEETGLAPELLELEITESMIMSNINQALEILAAIKNLGVRLAIDDFGTGYSSLSQLKHFPIDTLKVDRSFIRDIPFNGEDEAITEAIISMGKTLGVTVVAEGVETTAQHRFLNECYCDEMQGFLFNKPCHPDAFAEMFDKNGKSKLSG